MEDKFSKNTPLTVIELFAGVGAFSQALRNLQIAKKILFISEINKNAINVFNKLHGRTKNLKDIKTIKETQLKLYRDKCDILSFGSPCQDFSQAGKNKGGSEGSGTRSSLLWEALKIIKIIQPKIIVFENVQNLQSKHKKVLDSFIEGLKKLNYPIACQKIINSLYVNIPQNRPRLFVVAYNAECFQKFHWKNYQSSVENSMQYDQIERPTLRTFLKINDFKKRKLIKHLESKEIFNYTNFVSWRDNKGNKNGSYNRAWKIDKYAGSVTYCGDIKITDGKQFSKLTAEESWLLMGFRKKEYKKIDSLCSLGQLKSLAGNSVVVPVLELIIKSLPLDKLYSFKECDHVSDIQQARSNFDPSLQSETNEILS